MKNVEIVGEFVNIIRFLPYSQWFPYDLPTVLVDGSITKRLGTYWVASRAVPQQPVVVQGCALRQNNLIAKKQFFKILIVIKNLTETSSESIPISLTINNSCFLLRFVLDRRFLLLFLLNLFSSQNINNI